MAACSIRGILVIGGIFQAAMLLHGQTKLQIVTDALPDGKVGATYNQQLATLGGLCSSNGTASSKIDAGTLPAGLSVMSPASVKEWYLQGVPSASGSFSFTVHVYWKYNRAGPVDTDCTDDATKTFTLTVQSGTPPPPPPPTGSLLADRAQINATYRLPHFPPAADTVTVTATANAAVAITVQATTDSGGPWLAASTERATTPAALSISYLVNGLGQGTYTGRVTVSATGLTALTIPVTLVVSADASVQLQATPGSLSFASSLGGADPAAQRLNITVAGESALFQAAVLAAPPNGKWLSVTPSGAATPATLNVAVSAKDLPVGVYNGQLKLTPSGISTGSLTIPVTFSVLAAAPKPVISAGGVVNAAGLGSAIAPGTWVSIYGTALSVTTRAWRDTDIQNGRLPTALDGVSVTIDGKPAAVSFVSPLQVNVLAPDDPITGLVPVQVKSTLGTSDSALVVQQTAAPQFFQLTAATVNYALGIHVDGSLLAGPALVRAGTAGSPAKVGETIVLFGTGFGATQPASSATALVPVPLPLAHPEDLRIRIGGLEATIAYAGLISPGVYQFNLVVPQVGGGDQPVVAELRGLLTQTGLMLTIQP